MEADYAYMVENGQDLVTVAMGSTEEFASDDIDLAHVLLMFNEIPLLRQGGLNHFVEVLPGDTERSRALLVRFGRFRPYVERAAPPVDRPLTPDDFTLKVEPMHLRHELVRLGQPDTKGAEFTARWLWPSNASYVILDAAHLDVVYGTIHRVIGRYGEAEPDLRFYLLTDLVRGLGRLAHETRRLWRERLAWLAVAEPDPVLADVLRSGFAK